MNKIGDYEYNPHKKLGNGSFGVVYEGKCTKPPQSLVAIKVVAKGKFHVPPGPLSSSNLVGIEVKILTKLTKVHHEHIVKLLAWSESNIEVFLVMEYCNGGDLAAYLQRNGVIREGTMRLFLKQLAGAMKVLHDNNIVHRDLKPQNILLSHNVMRTPQPSDIKLKIADFGLARFLESGYKAGTLCGTPIYMAPEVRALDKYDGKADLWSLGMIVYQCVTGKTPDGRVPVIPRSMSASLRNLIEGLLKTNPNLRMNFQTFLDHEFLREDDGILTGVFRLLNLA
ncbi:hypothetical protein ABEB36_003307 [Hypothenemus hampei]|uniref:Protein kinase domain-containing protein n=1 Tax=Hypothenemus hampei TaxID=57062 RepID=A0ABD1F9F8_HYPHA